MAIEDLILSKLSVRIDNQKFAYYQRLSLLEAEIILHTSSWSIELWKMKNENKLNWMGNDYGNIILPEATMTETNESLWNTVLSLVCLYSEYKFTILRCEKADPSSKWRPVVKYMVKIGWKVNEFGYKQLINRIFLG